MALSGGLIGGIQIEPDGLQLLIPAKLTITVPKGYDRKQMVGIGYLGEGDGFHLDVVVGDGNTITLSILSFSGHRAASGTPGEVGKQAGQPTANAQYADAQKVASLIIQCVNGSSDADCMPLIKYVTEVFNNQVVPDLNKGLTDESLADSASAKYLYWEKSVQLLSLDRDIRLKNYSANLIAPLIEKGRNLVVKVLKHAYDKAFENCINQEDIS